MVIGRDVREQRPAAGIGLHNIAHPAHDDVAGEHRALGAVRKGERQHSPILDVDRIGVDERAALRRQASRDIADIGGDP